MKKLFILIISLLSITSVSNASFGDVSSLDLYINIDKGIDSLQDKMETFELEGGQKKAGILAEINKYALNNGEPTCLDESKSISINDFKKIVNEKNISHESGVMKYLLLNCINEILKEKGKEELNNFYKDALNQLNDNKWNNDIKASNCTNKTVKRWRKVGDKYEEYDKPMTDAICKDQKYKEEKKALLAERDENINNYGKDENGNIENKYLQEIVSIYQELFNVYNFDKTALAEIKTDQIYKISQIGIYADGSEENSGFDLITDIEEIDKIIFANVIDYEGEEVDSIDSSLNDFFKPLNEEIDKLTTPSPLIDTEDKEDKEDQLIQVSPIINNNTPDNTIETNNEYICSDELNNSGLSDNSLKGLLNNIENNLNGDNKINDNNFEPLSGNNSSGNNNSDNKNSNGSYEKVTDNSEWPCETFFCIMIDFKTYEHSLFGGGEDITIEYLLNRSNKHLSKAASTSLIPAKMSTGEFELGLKDLNLPDIFHLSFQISTKPIPILNIEKQGKQDETEFSAKNMLKEYYNLNGLNYDRRNDLDALVKLDADKQNVNNAAGLTIEELLKKQKENDSIIKERHKKTNTLRKAIEKKGSYGVMSTFEEQFTELDKFTVGINDYILNLDSLINQLREIPIEY